MSKASRMFQSRSDRADNLAIRPVAELDLPTFVEADLGACLAALYDSPAAAFLDEADMAIIPGAPFTDQLGPAAESHALLSFASKSTADASGTDDVLAILLQTIDSAARAQDFGNAEVVATAFPDESAFISASSPESRRTELFIVEKPVATIRPPAPFLTEVMDLEAIAACARESASGDSSAFAACEDPNASDVAKEQVVAEMNAVAEEFFAEQLQHAPASSAHESPQDRRLKRRALISAPIRVRTVEAESSGSQEIATTFDVSRSGILFHTQPSIAIPAACKSLPSYFLFSKSSKSRSRRAKGPRRSRHRSWRWPPRSRHHVHRGPF